MKAITVHQPYAELLISGMKLVENRSWSTRYRGVLAIHASVSKECLEETERDAPLTFGAVLGTVQLVDCVEMRALPPHLRDHYYAQGPLCWIVTSPVRFATPIGARGKQGLWEWNAPLATAPLSERTLEELTGLLTLLSEDLDQTKRRVEEIRERFKP